MGVHRAPRVRRFPPLLAPLLVVLAVVSAGAASATPAATATYLRLAQLTPTAPGTELVLSSVADPSLSVTIAGVGYGSVTSYRRIEPGDYVVGRRPAGSTAPPRIGTTLDVMAGSAYTLGVIGDGVTVLVDDLAAPPPGLGRLRVVDATTATGALVVSGPGGAVVADGLERGTAGPYGTVAAGQVVLEVRAGTAPATRLPVTVAPNQVVSVVLVSGPGSVQARVQVDSEGPVAVPPGPVDAGFGGTAGGDGPARGMAGPAVLALLAVAAFALSLRSGRRRAGAARTPSC